MTDVVLDIRQSGRDSASALLSRRCIAPSREAPAGPLALWGGTEAPCQAAAVALGGGPDGRAGPLGGPVREGLPRRRPCFRGVPTTPNQRKMG